MPVSQRLSVSVERLPAFRCTATVSTECARGGACAGSPERCGGAIDPNCLMVLKGIIRRPPWLPFVQCFAKSSTCWRIRSALRAGATKTRTSFSRRDSCHVSSSSGLTQWQPNDRSLVKSCGGPAHFLTSAPESASSRSKRHDPGRR